MNASPKVLTATFLTQEECRTKIINAHLKRVKGEGQKGEVKKKNQKKKMKKKK